MRAALIRILQLLLSWVFILAGFALGVWAIAAFAQCPVISGTWPQLLMLAVLGFVPLAGSVLAIRNRKHAAWAFLPTAPVFAASYTWFGRFNEWGTAYFTRMFGIFAGSIWVLAVPGLFWLVTYRRKWPPIASGAIQCRLRIALSSILLLTMVLAGTLGSLYLWPGYVGDFDCRKVTLPTRPSSDDQAVFTGKVIYVAHPQNSYGFSRWALVRVNKKFLLLGIETFDRFKFEIGRLMRRF